jgi:FkbM family methyltransferase
VGFYSAIFRKLVGTTGKVIAFEASRANYEQVVRVPALNGWENVEVRHAAIGPAHSQIEFIEFAGGSGGASGPVGLSPRFKSAEGIAAEIVECFGTDQLVLEASTPRPTFIKFDLEGAERFALHNGVEVFGKARPTMLLELHGREALDATVSFFDKYNYVGVRVDFLEQFANATEQQWLEALRAKTYRSGKALANSGELPHMLLLFPEEHPGVSSN